MCAAFMEPLVDLDVRAIPQTKRQHSLENAAWATTLAQFSQRKRAQVWAGKFQCPNRNWLRICIIGVAKYPTHKRTCMMTIIMNTNWYETLLVLW